MPAMEPLSQILGINSNNLTKNEAQILEANLYVKIYQEVKEIMKIQYKNYFYLMKFDNNMENTMIENESLRFIINDILSSGEYSVPGIAHYTNTPEEVIHEIIIGNNKNPSFIFSQRILELHCRVRPTMYQEIIKKLITNFR